MTWLVTGQVSPAWAYWIDGNVIAEACLSDDPSSQVACSFYVVGVADMLSAISELGATARTPLCAPDGTTPGQLVRVVVKHLKAHPEETHMAAVVQVADALNEAFSCQS